MDKEQLISIATECLKEFYGEDATFRDGQLEAIIAVLQGKRALVVQKTGWGKSLIYFLSTKILRKEGKGFALVISPLLALMNNQIESANKFGLNTRTINSNNKDEWEEIYQELRENKVDVLFIAPEKLDNEEFKKNVLNEINSSIGMLVIDEAHCISDWGHDFRPDYRRIINIVKFLPPNVPLLATTATANDRVVKDV
jgi:ATP-dependent DNA helicase RecQ